MKILLQLAAVLLHLIIESLLRLLVLIGLRLRLIQRLLRLALRWIAGLLRRIAGLLRWIAGLLRWIRNTLLVLIGRLRSVLK